MSIQEWDIDVLTKWRLDGFLERYGPGHTNTCTGATDRSANQYEDLRLLSAGTQTLYVDSREAGLDLKDPNLYRGRHRCRRPEGILTSSKSSGITSTVRRSPDQRYRSRFPDTVRRHEPLIGSQSVSMLLGFNAHIRPLSRASSRTPSLITQHHRRLGFDRVSGDFTFATRSRRRQLAVTASPNPARLPPIYPHGGDDRNHDHDQRVDFLQRIVKCDWQRYQSITHQYGQASEGEVSRDLRHGSGWPCASLANAPISA